MKSFIGLTSVFLFSILSLFPSTYLSAAAKAASLPEAGCGEARQSRPNTPDLSTQQFHTSSTHSSPVKPMGSPLPSPRSVSSQKSSGGGAGAGAGARNPFTLKSVPESDPAASSPTSRELDARRKKERKRFARDEDSDRMSVHTTGSRPPNGDGGTPKGAREYVKRKRTGAASQRHWFSQSQTEPARSTRGDAHGLPLKRAVTVGGDPEREGHFLPSYKTRWHDKFEKATRGKIVGSGEWAKFFYALDRVMSFFDNFLYQHSEKSGQIEETTFKYRARRLGYFRETGGCGLATILMNRDIVAFARSLTSKKDLIEEIGSKVIRMGKLNLFDGGYTLLGFCEKIQKFVLEGDAGALAELIGVLRTQPLEVRFYFLIEQFFHLYVTGIRCARQSVSPLKRPRRFSPHSEIEHTFPYNSIAAFFFVAPFVARFVFKLQKELGLTVPTRRMFKSHEMFDLYPDHILKALDAAYKSYSRYNYALPEATTLACAMYHFFREHAEKYLEKVESEGIIGAELPGFLAMSDDNAIID